MSAGDRNARLAALGAALRGHDFYAELADGALTVAPPHPGRTVTVRCAHRASDGGRLWFVAGDLPLAEADNITQALIALKGLTAPRM